METNEKCETCKFRIGSKCKRTGVYISENDWCPEYKVTARAKQLNFNCNWLINKIDIMHDILCPGELGTWQEKTQQVVDAIKKLKGRRNNASL
uniref:Uncharacterized protein n=1 Tax=viral metagenome TaxID=1070528 RepID=A0A6M3JLR2_9ZZZZ